MKILLKKFKKVKSTNDTALNLIKKQNLSPIIVASDTQSRGKGTMGKRWISRKGNLFISILFEMKSKKIDFKQYAILNAYVIKKIISKYISKKASIKWPNDVIVQQEKFKKIAGILAEYVQQENPVLIVGMGLNIGWPKSEDSGPPESTSLTACGIDKDRWELLAEILKNFEKRLVQITVEKEVSGFIEDYCSKSSTIGHKVRVDKADGDIIGRAVGIEKDGSLIIENDNGATSFSAADVTQLRKL